jgi:hypothetical protein
LCGLCPMPHDQKMNNASFSTPNPGLGISGLTKLKRYPSFASLHLFVEYRAIFFSGNFCMTPNR